MKHRYKITVDGTGIREYYEFDQRYSEDDVKDIWLSDAKAKWGEGVKVAFSGRVSVEEITDNDQPPALP